MVVLLALIEMELVAPNWNLHKKWVLNNVDKIMREKNLYQGMYN